MAMLPKMLERERIQAGWSVGRASWELGVSIREYRELEAGKRSPNWETWDRDLQDVLLAADVRVETLTGGDLVSNGTAPSSEQPA